MHRYITTISFYLLPAVFAGLAVYVLTLKLARHLPKNKSRESTLVFDQVEPRPYLSVALKSVKLRSQKRIEGIYCGSFKIFYIPCHKHQIMMNG